jgi:hypothetical protein
VEKGEEGEGEREGVDEVWKCRARGEKGEGRGREQGRGRGE